MAIALYWAMFYGMGYQSGYNEGKAQVENKHYAADSGKQIERECGAKSGQPARECITKIIESEHESQRDESDLAAQWKAADWAFWAAVIAGAQLIATVIGLYYVKGTLDATWHAVEDTGQATGAMLEANEIAKLALNVTEKTMQKQLRAYIGCRIVKEPKFSFDKEMTVLIEMKNFGQTPALDFQAELCFALAGYPDPPLLELDFRDNGSISSMFPNEIIMTHASIRDPIGRVVYDDIVQGTEIRIYLWSRYRYRDIFGTWYEGGFRYELGGQMLSEVSRMGRSPRGNYEKIIEE